MTAHDISCSFENISSVQIAPFAFVRHFEREFSSQGIEFGHLIGLSYISREVVTILVNCDMQANYGITDMDAVEQNPEFLNLDSEEADDAYDAWSLLATNLDKLPVSVRPYFDKLCAKVDEFDPHEDDEIALTYHLEVPVIRPKKQRKPLGAKSKHDYAQIFDWVEMWRRESDADLEKALEEYIKVFDLEDGYETIKSAYHKVRRARLSRMDQDRPHFDKMKRKSE